MGRRQPKVTESFAVKKSAGLKMTVKRKVLINDKDEGVENINSSSSASSTAVAASSLEYVDNFQAAKNALHMARPAALIAREEEINTVYGWLDDRLTNKSPGSMYISGAPGTGKTAVVLHSIHEWLSKNKAANSKVDPIWHLVINCMNVTSPTHVYAEMAAVLGLGKVHPDENPKDVVGAKILSKFGRKMMVLVLDEMDQLLTTGGGGNKGTDLLYTLFDWAKLAGSHLVVIGIANALDLTVRHLPMLNLSLNNSPVQRSPSSISSATSASKPGRRPMRPTASSSSTTPSSKKKLLNESSSTPTPNNNNSTDFLLLGSISPMQIINFTPYERQDIENILEARLMEIGSNIFEPSAIKFVAAKVAATTGDMRKALNACKLALDAVERQQREALRSTADDGFNFSSPKKFCMIREKINVGMVSKVFAPPKDDGPLPLQQMILLATLLRLNKIAPHSKNSKADGLKAPIPMILVYDEYRKICAAKGFSWIDRSEIVSVASMLQDRSLVTVVENMTGGGCNSGGSGVGKNKKLSTMTTANKTGFLISSYNAVDKIVMQCDMKSIVE